MKVTINILSTNDIHGRFLGGHGEAGKIDFSSLRTYRKSLENSLLVDVGDATQGTPLAVLNKGLDPIQIMNAVGYDVTTIGNHEFDNITLKDGTEHELDAIIKTFQAPYICTNVYLKKPNGETVNYIDSVYQKYNITDSGNGRYLLKEIAGKKMLFVGVCTPDISPTPKMEPFVIKGKKTKGSEDSMLLEIRSAITAAKNETKYEKFDAVILLTHLGKSSSNYSSLNLIDSLEKEGENDVKLIIDGHSHQEYFDKPTKERPNIPYLIQADCYGHYCAHIELVFDDSGKLTISKTFLTAENLEKHKQNPTVKKCIETIKLAVDKEFGKAKCAGSNTTLWGGAVDEARPFVPKDLAAINVTRYVHTNMGRLVAESMANYVCNNKPDYFANAFHIIAGLNGGAVRDSIRFGEKITFGKIYNVTPSQREGKYDSGITVFKIKLSKLKEVLEHSISGIKVENHLLSTNAGTFLNTFGIEYTVDYGNNDNAALKINNSATLTCAINSSSLPMKIDFIKDGDKKVLLCLNKYLATGGDGYPFKFETDPDYVRDSAEIDTPLYKMIGDHIEKLAGSSEKMLKYPTASGDVQYSGFNFPKPGNLRVTVNDMKGKSRNDQKVAYTFVGAEGKRQSGVAVTNHTGTFTVQPPTGANTLCIALLLGKTPINQTFLYGEVFTHSYFKMERNIECQVSEVLSTENTLLGKNHLSQFEHNYLSDGARHHSNYIDYVNEDRKECSLIILDNQMYCHEKSEQSFTPVDSLIYRNGNSGLSTLTLPFPEEGIDYIPSTIAIFRAKLVK